MPIIRKRFVTDRGGNEIEITSQDVLQEIVDQMAPEELERFKAQYRFTPVHNDISWILGYWYGGSLRDLG